MGRARRLKTNSKRRDSPTRSKLSACLVELIKPYRSDRESQKEYERLVLLGTFAWNLPLLRAVEQSKLIAQVVDSFPAADRRMASVLIHVLVRRRNDLFSSDRRMIVSFEVIARPGAFAVTVASFDANDEQ